MEKFILFGINEDGDPEDLEVEIGFDEFNRVSAIIKSGFVSLDLTPLSNLTSLQSLEISGNEILESLDLALLSSLTNLQKLTVANESKTSLDLTPLSNLTSLQELLLADTNSTNLDLTRLSSLANLQSLSIYSYSALTSLDLTPLSSLTNLQSLAILGSESLPSLDLTPLSSLIGLKELDITSMSLESLDLAPLSSSTSLQTLVIRYNSNLTSLDLTPLSSLTNLQSLDISSNDSLKSLDSAPLSNLIDLTIRNNKSLTSLDISFLSRLTSLKSLNLVGNRSFENMDCFLSESTIDSLISSSIRYFDKPIRFAFTSLNSFQFISELLPIVKKHEQPWKMHHLIQSTLALIGLEGLGLLDIDHSQFAQILQKWDEPDFKEIARERFTKHWVKQVDSGGTTIGVSWDYISKIVELAKRVGHINNLRNKEVEDIILIEKEGVIDLESLYLTAYGYQILQALGMGMTCTEEEFESISQIYEELGFSLKIGKKNRFRFFRENIKPTSHISESLAEYIMQLVKIKIFGRAKSDLIP